MRAPFTLALLDPECNLVYAYLQLHVKTIHLPPDSCFVRCERGNYKIILFLYIHHPFSIHPCVQSSQDHSKHVVTAKFVPETLQEGSVYSPVLRENYS